MFLAFFRILCNNGIILYLHCYCSISLILQFKVRAAGGNGLAVTEVMFLDATLDDFQTFSYEEDPDWTDGLCSCCLEAPVVRLIQVIIVGVYYN